MTQIRPLSLTRREDLICELKRIGVDERGLEILTEKAQVLTLKLSALSSAQCNILKQSALSCGADCAVNRKVISADRRRFDSVLLGTERQLKRLAERLCEQPIGMDEVSARILEYLSPPEPIFRLKGYGDIPKEGVGLVGIINLTPDSFYDGGRYQMPDQALARAEALGAAGADILDLGAESTRPGARLVTAEEELSRLRPVLKLLRSRVAIPISVDTYKARVAEEMLDLGVDLINDISGLHFDESLASVVARFDAGLVIMHIKGRPRTMQRNPRYKDLMGEIYWYLSDGLERARQAGVAQSRIIVDPGIGFGKSFKDNHQILRRLSELNGLGRPIMVGLSRKSFIGNILNLPSEERLEGSLSAAVLALLNGARWLRVHDLEATRRAVRVAEAILKE